MNLLPKLVLVTLVCGLLLFALAGCKATGNTLARWGGAAGGALAGGAIAGPAGAAVGAVAGDAGGDALVEDPPQSVTNIDVRGGGTAYLAHSAPEPWYTEPLWWIAAYGVFRFRAGLLAFARSLFTGGFGASLMTLLGMVFGGKVADKAKASVATHMARRRRGPPAVVVSSEVKPHA